MKRKSAWIAMCVTLLSGVTALGQGPNPYGNPSMFRIPGYPALPQVPTPPTYPYAQPPSFPYSPMPPSAPMAPQFGPQYPWAPSGPGGPMPPYGPGAPMPPYGPGAPMLPYGPGAPNPYGPGAPVPIPPDPRLPFGQRPQAPPQYIGGPQGAPAEPYFVNPQAQPQPRQLPDKKPEAKPGNVVTEPLNRLIQFVAPAGPSEPYTTYEGPRYQAEVKQDNTRIWGQVNYIHLWTRGDNAPPLVSTGNAANVVLGNGSIGPGEFSGVQTTLGMWLDDERLTSIEVSGFLLPRLGRQYPFVSDPGGSPAIGQPVIIGGAEAVINGTQPGVTAGTLSVNSMINFHSLELNLARNILRLNGFSLDYLLGIRYLYLNDSLDINQNVTVLPGGAGAVNFNGGPQPAGSNLLFNDSFNTTNRFYGGTIGARLNWTYCRFDIGAGAKVSFGATAHTANINGFTTLNDVNGGVTTLQGSSLAQASNIGRFTSTDFSVVPEFSLTAGYQVTPHIRVLAGYTFLDWNHVQRVGGQLDRNIDVNQVPTSPAFVPGTTGGNPRFLGTRTDFWTQGVSVGVEIKF